MQQPSALTSQLDDAPTGVLRPDGSRRRNRHSWLFRHALSFRTWSLVPLLGFVALFAAYPIVQLVRMGFSTVTMRAGEFQWTFTGLDNARQAITDEVFHVAMRNTVVFVVVTTTVQVVIGTTLAIVIDRSGILSRVAKSVLLWPTIIAPVVISAIWWLILSPQFGGLNHLLGALGLPQQGWLGSSRWALPALMLVDVWHWTPLVLLIVYAGLQAIDRTLIEAALVDGATQWHVVRHVLIPLLMPTIAAAALIRVILAFKVFDEMHLLTGGGPGISTTVLSIYIRDVFFSGLEMGYGAFLGLVVVAAMLVIFIAVPAIAATRRRTTGAAT